MKKKPKVSKPEDTMAETVNDFMKRFGINEIVMGKRSIKKSKGKKAKHTTSK